MTVDGIFTRICCPTDYSIPKLSLDGLFVGDCVLKIIIGMLLIQIYLAEFMFF